MTFDERLKYLSDAHYHIIEAVNVLKRLGHKYTNDVDVLGDIQFNLEIDEITTEEDQRKYWEREERAMISKYQRQAI